MLPFKIIRKKDPKDKDSPTKFYAHPVARDTISLRELGDIIVRRSSLTRGDVANVLTNLSELLPELLKQGYKIDLGDMGTFRPSFGSEGAETADNFRADMIRKPKVIYRPHKLMVRELENAEFEKIK
ncbi:hypothetical protein FUAX_17010 [Fulvitalea axinellae]|uniref:HU domain-containing protein n=1 Tax=Fulvitalea axinellae TaxID=1182444 RepID=A0AAU9CB02_9BACT|nr:hypothetical protein FUAX_17010 [Fulvitalea axinellae]